DCEHEADSAAAAFANGERAPVIAANSPPVIRRAVSLIGPASLTVTKAAKTACGLSTVGTNASSGGALVKWHLTAGFNSAAPASSGAAWTATGSVPLLITANNAADVAQNQADLAKWKFGFKQFMLQNTFTYMFAGINVNHGGVLMDA